MTPLIGKIAIVTGASRGIGRAIAERLTQDGASVVVNYAQSADQAKEVVSAIETGGGQALALQADISKVADVHRLFQETVDRFGQLNILVNNGADDAFNPDGIFQDANQQVAVQNLCNKVATKGAG
ncbi:SDR family NAD(P)-dependent oxidoreductase [Nostoc sp.]|uniref:SDR family NAD(P)-dependent oxidoreductase n=1 Tax=Nostoc sp. TaxID=1180 RepID=UPI002FFB278A